MTSDKKKERKDHGLSYYLPKEPRKHTRLRIPGSHYLFVGPCSCTRSHAMRALEERFVVDKYGLTQSMLPKPVKGARQVSFLHITEADVASGKYENIVGDAVADIIAVVDPAPHIFFIDVFCIDDFLGTDEEELLRGLKERFPDRQFCMEHIDPVSYDHNENMGKYRIERLYSFIEPRAEHDMGVTFMGNFIPLNEDCELFDLFRLWGAGPMRQLFDCKTYEDYQALGKSRVTMLVRFAAEHASDMIERVHGIPRFDFPASYDTEFIMGRYRALAEIFGGSAESVEELAQETERYARETARMLNERGICVAIDCDACLLPYSAARGIMRYGFNVKHLFVSRHTYIPDLEDKLHIMEHCPQVRISRTDDYENLQNPIREPECLTVGVTSASLLGAKYKVDLWHDENHYGLRGIRRLMERFREAIGLPTGKED